MKNCSHADCDKNAIYLSNSCWSHMSDRTKATYKQKLQDKLSENKVIANENFHGAVLQGLEIPEYSALRECDFTDADLTGSVLRRIDFSHSKFDRATVKDCRCEYSDFRGEDTCFRDADVRATHFDGALLQNVDFTNADLRDAVLIEADMIGVFLSGAQLYAARLLNTRLRKESLCNFRRTSSRQIEVGDGPSRKTDSSKLNPLMARYVYSALRNNFRSIGEYGDERWARSKERKMERKRLFRLAFLNDRDSDSLALERWLPEDKNKIIESRPRAGVMWIGRCFLTVLAYGESPFVFLLISAVLVIAFAFLLMFSGFEYSVDEKWLPVSRERSFDLAELPATLDDLKTSFYFSIVTFTTLGYGDARPVGGTRLIAATEALLGLLAYSSFAATFLKWLSNE